MQISVVRGNGSTSAGRRSSAAFALRLFPPPQRLIKRGRRYEQRRLQGWGKAHGGGQRESHCVGKGYVQAWWVPMRAKACLSYNTTNTCENISSYTRISRPYRFTILPWHKGTKLIIYFKLCLTVCEKGAKTLNTLFNSMH